MALIRISSDEWDIHGDFRTPKQAPSNALCAVVPEGDARDTRTAAVGQVEANSVHGAHDTPRPGRIFSVPVFRWATASSSGFHDSAPSRSPRLAQSCATPIPGRLPWPVGFRRDGSELQGPRAGQRDSCPNVVARDGTSGPREAGTETMLNKSARRVLAHGGRGARVVDTERGVFYAAQL
ncbi:uncharacterized protein FIBRA_05736 [Fibroporia radiculosa]|uniref:Uncharacterized protein n=1 Tax=Fibroporia radiculosa TaxID=599839 RepID=J4GA07_9APHY|nr:uncharacterized protein FIBRA_05736 [Fibroporia radiculosa]CCM03598.1 predicted protein [Fibroporia radiculosa]